ncbi:ATP-binding protein [Aquincola sp. MAHUQ-54]|uniref:ATP-binding protein n=1 Tax=Aquincola agrisoli TaxID=3119538 RepID=A0AAW9Q059_9BURK
MNTPRLIALLGAESTGKTDLAHALAERIGRHRPCRSVDEYLREWCDEHGRTPRADEQAAIAAEQRRRIHAALDADGEALVIADTTPLMTAVYSDYIFDDPSLYEEALRWQREHAGLTLLTALDLPWLPDGLMRDGPQVREPVDRLLRTALSRAGIGYGVVYGEGAARVDAALRAVERWQPVLPAASQPPAEAPARQARIRWRRRCLDCLDPGCERLLHTG